MWDEGGGGDAGTVLIDIRRVQPVIMSDPASCEPLEFQLPVANNPVIPVLLVQFAVERAGDEAAAKLARQIPRALGRRLARSGRFEVRTFIARDRVDGREVFINSTALPDPDALAALAGMHHARVVLAGKIGVGERIRIEARIYDAGHGREVYAKGFDVYATYTFDALEELTVRLAQIAGIEMTRDERVQLLRRETESWEAYLYFLLAEDDRYGLSLGLAPDRPLGTVDMYCEALAIDAEFEAAESGVVAYLLEALQRETISETEVDVALQRVAALAPTLLSARRALLYRALADDQFERAHRIVSELRSLHPDHQDLLRELEELVGR